MNRNMTLLLGLAFGAAILIAAVVQFTLGRGSNDELGKILVANHDLPAGSFVTEDDFEWSNWPEGAEPQDSITVAEYPFTDGEESNIRLIRGIMASQPILTGNLVDVDGSSYLAAALDPGMVAVTIPVEQENMVAGFVLPGSFVNVTWTYEIRLPGGTARNPEAASIVSQYSTETLLSGIRVLAVDQAIQDLHNDAVPGRNVTLEVTQEQSEQLALAQRMGELNLVLRSMGENDELSKLDENSFTSDVQIGRALRAATIAVNGEAIARNPEQIIPAPETEGTFDWTSLVNQNPAPTAPPSWHPDAWQEQGQESAQRNTTVRIYHGSSVQTITP